MSPISTLLALLLTNTLATAYPTSTPPPNPNQTQPTIINSTLTSSLDKADKGTIDWNAILGILAVLSNLLVIWFCFRDHWRRQWGMEREGWRWEVVEEVRLQLGEREAEREKAREKGEEEGKEEKVLDAGEMVGEGQGRMGGGGEGFSRDEGGQ